VSGAIFPVLLSLAFDIGSLPASAPVLGGPGLLALVAALAIGALYQLRR